MLDAIRLCADVAGNVFYERLWLRVLDQVTGGKQICEALGQKSALSADARADDFDRRTNGQARCGARAGEHYYDQEVESSLKTVTSMLEPIMITVMGVVVGGIAMSLLLPIFSLSRTPG